MTLTDAIELNRVDVLQQMKDSGSLPNLMEDLDTSKSQWYPHEIAIKWGNLEALKWLVNDSGQTVDLTVFDNRGVVTAAAYEHLDVLKWMVLESKQPVLVKIDPDDTSWYKSDHYHNHAIENFLEAVNQLHMVGVSSERIQSTPNMVRLVEDGRFSARIVSQLTPSDIELAAGVTPPTRRTSRRL